jgi:ABC-2 type transport system ATP-binding protein
LGERSHDPVLELVAIRKRYARVSALEGLDLRLDRGQVYGFLGRNGAGKSTTLRLVMGITRPDQGTIKLFGSAVRPSDIAPRRRIGYVAQEQHFYAWMTPERLGAFVAAFYPSWDSAHYAALTRQFGVPPRKIGTFSGGTKVKLALALALAHRPELLVLDEPTAGLDAVVRREFIEIVRELGASGQHSTLFSSHLIGEVEELSQQVGIIEGGVMRYQGPLRDLAARVRSLHLPLEALEPFQGAGRSQAEGVRTLLDALPIRLLRLFERGSHIELTLWSDVPDAFHALQARLPSASFKAMSLEDNFVALVRTDAEPWPAPPAQEPR